jgi:hypothetical protein
MNDFFQMAGVDIFVSLIFTKEPISWWLVFGGILFSLIPTTGALILIQKGHRLKKSEETQP